MFRCLDVIVAPKKVPQIALPGKEGCEKEKTFSFLKSCRWKLQSLLICVCQSSFVLLLSSESK